MNRSCTAFCPGHITAFFEICDEPPEELRKGSRGAGLCLTLGARSRVEAADSAEQSVKVRIDGQESAAAVTKDAVQQIIADRPLAISIDTTLDLPVEQGFGMSAAGSLSATFALCEILGIDKRKAFEAAHISEVRNRTGLGDISGLLAGGAEARIVAGLPPYGKVESLDCASEIVMAVVGKPIKTPDVLTDKVKRKKIIDSGRRCVDEYIQHMTLEHMFALGMEFLEDTELASKPVLAALRSLDENDMGAMVMLGNSVFAIGDPDRIAEALGVHGKTYRCSIDKAGPRII